MKHTDRPPRLADKLFAWYCRHAAVEDLHGDVEELFYKNLERMPPWRARAVYWKHVWSLMFSYAVKKRKRHASFHPLTQTAYHPAMIKNYVLIATRNLVKHKFFTIINVVGLALGMSFSLLLIALLSFVWTYDTFHVNKDRIYRVITQTDNLQDNDEFATAPAGLADMLKDGHAGVEQVVRISRTLSGEATHEQVSVPLHGYFVDNNFLDVFSFPLRNGNPQTALQKPHTLAITESAAQKMFDTADPVGKVIRLGDLGDFEITAVLRDPPKNSHMQFEVLGSYETLAALGATQAAEGGWRDFTGSYLYLLLPPSPDVAAVETFLQRIATSVYAKEENFRATFQLQSLLDIAPGPELYQQIGPEWGYASLSIFMALTLMILLPACFNYANISISRAIKRMKEIGLRKVMGGQRDQIFFQFIMETVVVTTISLGLAYYIFALVRAEFLAMIVGADALDLNPDARTLGLFVLFALLVGCIAGVVPALYFSKLSPIDALKNKPAIKRSSSLSLRKVLIVSQFALSLGFIMSVVIVLSQYRYALNRDFGFEQANILDVQLQGVDPALFRNEFSKLSAVQAISMSSHVLGTAAASSVWVQAPESRDSAEVFQMFTDEQYLHNLKLTLLAGQGFPAAENARSRYVIVNEEFLKAFGIAHAAAALNKTFVLPAGEEVMVAGVVKNFHYASLREPIGSFFFRYDPSQFQYANLKLLSGDMFEAISGMEAAWKVLGGEQKFAAQFFDDEIKETYAVYFVMVKICGFLGVLAITISCLGLLGMVVFTVENRMKEMGIRKVMGASTRSVTMLVSQEFIWMMAIAAMIAVPATYFLFGRIFLSNEYYRITIGFAEIGISLLVMFGLGLLTILTQTVKAARANPVDTLRYE